MTSMWRDPHEHAGQPHAHPGGVRGRLRSPFRPHSHDRADAVDSALESSAEGIRAVKISLVALAVTAVAQGAVVLSTGSVALLADTIHNFADARTAVPLWIAFLMGRRMAFRRYTYGYGRGGPGGRAHRRRDRPVRAPRRVRVSPAAARP